MLPGKLLQVAARVLFFGDFVLDEARVEQGHLAEVGLGAGDSVDLELLLD